MNVNYHHSRSICFLLLSAVPAAQLEKNYDDYACVFQIDGQTEITWDENTRCRVSAAFSSAIVITVTIVVRRSYDMILR